MMIILDTTYHEIVVVVLSICTLIASIVLCSDKCAISCKKHEIYRTMGVGLTLEQWPRSARQDALLYFALATDGNRRRAEER